ncbi:MULTISPECIES: PepSY domain-containing protein [Bacillus]|uniref:PepSY domain-containing protein n=1 Tax=Bacillus TaxID=1386 RepID=UPI0002EBD605|nr:MULTISPECIES: PepSY domain-containing protein [Bacillus]MDN0041277.1 PepSY domain-containing protein [Bacillus aerophilus]ATH71904.1 peptidase [Bacillus altitudinis]MDE0638865.1 PepSY domain-containing protein [Bacillus altitudinis]MDH3110286.1 PepSY domain-containing protein [Bacillus altitudinis]MDN4637290.1 PepSY domain-containing protein [Bacillus sp. PsM16]
MSKKMKMLLTLAGCLFILVAFAMLMIQTIDQKILSEADIKKIIAKDYNGNITNIDLINHKQDYTLTLENSNGIYQIIASSSSGQMKEMKQLKSYQKPNEKNAELQAEEVAVKKVKGTVIQKKEKSDRFIFTIQSKKELYQVDVEKDTFKVIEAEKKKPTSKEKKLTKITVEEAIQIAVKEVGGTVDDADLETFSGMLVFEVELDLPDGREAEVLVNAYTGDIEGITYEN